MRSYLYCLSRLQRLLWWDSHLPLPQELLSEVGDVSSCDGNVLYTAANDISFSLRDRQTETKLALYNVQHNGEVHEQRKERMTESFVIA